jgi:hypothetical protein
MQSFYLVRHKPVKTIKKELKFLFGLKESIGGADVYSEIGHVDLTMSDPYSHLSFDPKPSKQKQLADHYVNGANPEQVRHRLDNTPNQVKIKNKADQLSG